MNLKIVPDIEPDLNSPIADGYRSTWGDKKQLCRMEAESAIEHGLGAYANPYDVYSWPWRWWNESFLHLSPDGTMH